MTRGVVQWLLGILLATVIGGCGETADQPRILISKQPVSVRGWIREVVPTQSNIQVLDPALAATRRIEMLRESAISVEGAQWASGGLAEQGSFIILDVPPGDVSVLFQMYGVGDLHLPLKNLPGNADVLLPAMDMSAAGIRFADPSKIVVRIPGKERRPTALWAMVGPHRVQVVEVPLSDLADRREYPEPDQQRPSPVLGVKVQ